MENNTVISNRKAERAVNRGSSTMELPWPTDRLGVYGSRMFDGSPVSPDATDRAMDLYVSEIIAPDPDVQVIGACAGRTRKGEPVIVVTIGPRPYGKS